LYFFHALRLTFLWVFFNALFFEECIVFEFFFLRDLGCIQFLVLNECKVYFLEPAVRLEFLHAPLHAAQPLVGFDLHQLGDQEFALPADPGGLVDFSFDYLLEQLLAVLVHEGGHAHCHLLDQAAQSPEVDGLPVSATLDDLGCKLLGCTAETVGLVHFLHVGLTQSEVCDFTLAVSVE